MPGCDGIMELERHLEGCDCVPWGEPCAVCAQAMRDCPAAKPQPWVICSSCDWIEADGGVSAHARAEAMRRRRAES